MAQIVPRLECSPNEERKIIETLKNYLLHKSKIVKVSAMEALAEIAEMNDKIMGEIIQIIKAQNGYRKAIPSVFPRILLNRQMGICTLATATGIRGFINITLMESCFSPGVNLGMALVNLTFPTVFGWIRKVVFS